MAQRVEESDAAPAPLRAAGGAGQGGQTEQTLVPLHRPEELTLQLNEVRGDMRTKLATEHLKWEGATAQTSLETRMPAPERGARGPPVRRHPVSEGRDVSSQYGGMDETCPLCTGGEGGVGGACAGTPRQRGCRGRLGGWRLSGRRRRPRDGAAGLSGHAASLTPY